VYGQDAKSLSVYTSSVGARSCSIIGRKVMRPTAPRFAFLFRGSSHVG
jgi:hypothetical protein